MRKKLKRILNNILDKIRLIVTIIAGFFFVVGITPFFIPDMELAGKIFGTLMMIVSGSLLYVIIYFWWGKDHRCPSCKKPYCLKKTGREVKKKEPISVLVRVNSRNNNGEITGTQEQYVPGEKITYKVNFVCRKCGEACYETHTEKVANV